MTLGELCDALRAEATTLGALLERSSIDPAEKTPFAGWRVRDVVGHLVTIDRLALLTITDEAVFAAEHTAFVEGVAAHGGGPPEARFRGIAAYEDRRLGLLGWAQLRAAWQVGLEQLLETARRAPDDAKVRWFGPPMGLPSLLKARQMEVYAYGQDVFDLHRVPRPLSDRLWSVADFAVRTFGFSFANRGLEAPARPFVSLRAPSGAVWTWNSPAAAERIEGAAEDFCLVAVQRRNVADTALTVVGEGAAQWMRIAQCIAGPPVDPPAPTERAWERAGRGSPANASLFGEDRLGR